MQFDEALKTAEEFVATLNREGSEPLALMPDRTRILPYGWVFFYQSERFIASGDPRDGVAGNAPLLVTHAGESHVLGTGRSLDHYLREFERSGSPHPPPAGAPVQVRITGWRAGLKKVSMTMAIRDETRMGLGAAKSITDAVLEGNTAAVPVRDWRAAIRLAEALEALGAEARPERIPAAEPGVATDGGPE